MTKQEIFNKAFLGVYQQNKLSKIKDDCALRGENNCKCAIGFIISDEQITKYQVQEGDFPIDFADDLMKELLSNDEAAIDFLIDIQHNLHDQFNSSIRQPFTRDKLIKAAEKMAKHYQLDLPKIS